MVKNKDKGCTNVRLDFQQKIYKNGILNKKVILSDL